MSNADFWNGIGLYVEGILTEKPSDSCDESDGFLLYRTTIGFVDLGKNGEDFLWFAVCD